MYHKKPCIICKNLTLKGFFGMWVQIIYTTIDSEKLFSQDVGCDGTDISEDLDLKSSTAYPICLNKTSLRPTFVFRIDRCSVYMR